MIIPTALPKSLLSFFLFSSLEATAKRNLVPLRGLYCPKELDAGLSSKMEYMELWQDRRTERRISGVSCRHS